MILIDADQLLEELNNRARRLHRINGRWNGTSAGRSSGIYLAMNLVQGFKETELKRATQNE